MSTTVETQGIRGLSGTYNLDSSHSRLGFVARHAMVAKVRGSFDTFEGSGTIDGADITKSSVNVTIDANSINTGNADRDAHLRSNDFFGSDEHPEIVFVSTSVAKTGSDSIDITGDLSIRGVTKSITIPFTFEGAATDPFGNVRAGFEGKVVVNRKDFGIEWNAALETGGVLVSEKVTLEFEISAIKTA